jgi:hypothetical protein
MLKREHSYYGAVAGGEQIAIPEYLSKAKA